MCLLACLTQNIPVPELNYPLYTAAMRGLVVTCSGLDKSQKVSTSVYVNVTLLTLSLYLPGEDEAAGGEDGRGLQLVLP